jgi:MFS family permease
MDAKYFLSPLQSTLDTKPHGLRWATSRTSEESFFLQPLDLAPDPTTRQKRRQQILIVVSCLVLTFTGCGFNFAFGVYQEHYEKLQGPFKDASPGQIDIIGTLAASLMTIGAPFASSSTRTYGPRHVTTFGGVLFAISSISASLGTRLWHFQLTQGLLQGCAACLAYIPAVTVSPAFFNERRGLAMGIILSGTGLGGVAWAPILRYLITAIGFRNTLRVMGVLALTLITISASVLKEAEDSKMDVPLKQPGESTRCVSVLPKVNWKIARSKAFFAHATGGFLHSAAYFTPIYFMSSYATTLGYSNISGAHIIALSNFCNFGGKIVIGCLADRFGRLNALVLSTLISAAVTFGLWSVSYIQSNPETSRALLLAYACIYGLTAGSYVSLFPVALAEHFGIQNFASINGLIYMIRGFGTLIGTAIGGALVKKTQGGGPASVSFDRTFLFVGILLSGATFSIAWARSMKKHTELEWRA